MYFVPNTDGNLNAFVGSGKVILVRMDGCRSKTEEQADTKCTDGSMETVLFGFNHIRGSEHVTNVSPIIDQEEPYPFPSCTLLVSRLLRSKIRFIDPAQVPFLRLPVYVPVVEITITPRIRIVVKDLPVSEDARILQ